MDLLPLNIQFDLLHKVAVRVRRYNFNICILLLPLGIEAALIIKLRSLKVSVVPIVTSV